MNKPVISPEGQAIVDQLLQCTPAMMMKLHGIETAEAVSACGFEGMCHGLNEYKKGVVAAHPDQLKNGFDAGVGLVIGE